jgi:GNAT superfamily N-acetyltransferase
LSGYPGVTGQRPRRAITAESAVRLVSPAIDCLLVTRAVIRQAGVADTAVAARLRRDWVREQEGDRGDPAFEDRFAAWFERESPRRVTWLAEVGGHPVGMMNLAVFERMPRPGRPSGCWGHLSNAFVLAAYRNQGIGRMLLDAVLSHARENGFARVVLSPSARSVPFYRRAGFAPAESLMLWTPPETQAGAPPRQSTADA